MTENIKFLDHHNAITFSEHFETITPIFTDAKCVVNVITVFF